MLDAIGRFGLLLFPAIGLLNPPADPPEATREAACVRASRPPVLDGKLDDPCWTEARVIDKFPAFWLGRASGKGTKARLVWDDEALYFSAEMTDEEIRSVGTKRNDHLWEGDVFELFFKPSTDAPAYYEFQVNPRSVILELAFPRRGYSFDELASKPPMGMQGVARVDTRPAGLGVSIRGWIVEGKIPWTIFAPTGGRPRPGDAWRFALCRFDYGADGTKPIMMSSAPLTKPSFHNYEDYGRLVFEGPK